MKIFGSFSELVSLIFRKNSQSITLTTDSGTTYTASRTISLPPGDADQSVVSAAATQTLTNKTISGASNTLSNIPLGSATGTLAATSGGTGVSSTATFPTSGVIVTEAATETLTNKTIDGTSNTLSNVPLGSATGTLALGNGGTGQTTAAAAFGALSPLTTKGDLLGFSTLSTRLPVGTNGQSLIADSTQALGVKWGSASAGNASADGSTYGSITTYTPAIKSSINTVSGADYTVLYNDGYSDIVVTNSGASRTITLPVAANSVGRVIRIHKTDTNFAVFVAPASGEVLDVYGLQITGTSSQAVVDVPGDCITLECVSTSSVHWRTVSGGSAQFGVSLSGSGVFSAGTLSLRKKGQVVSAEVTHDTTWGGSGVRRSSNSGLVPSGFRPGNDTIWGGAFISGDPVFFSVDSSGTLSVYTGGATAMPYSVTIHGSYFLRA